MEFRKAIVLVVDDNPLIRMGAVDNVVTAGFGALEASNAEEAIRILEARPDIHMVLTDVEMLGSHGRTQAGPLHTWPLAASEVDCRIRQDHPR